MDSTLSLEGDMAEIGVYKGETSKIIHAKAPAKIMHLYDTFKGVAMADKSIDVHGNGDFAVPLETVKKTVGVDNVEYHEGIFPDTFKEQDRMFCFVYSDTDTYFGTKATLSIFAPVMVSGGKIMFDDYGWRGCPGVKKAITEFLSGKDFKTVRQDSQFTITFP